MVVFKQMEMLFPPVSGANDAEIMAIWSEGKEQLREQLLTQRHNFNRNFFMLDDNKGIMNREALGEAFKSGLINHSFNTTENFDNIYDPNYNKGFVLSRADVDDVASEEVKPETWAKALKNLRNLLGNPRKEGDEVSLNNMYFSLEKSIRRSITIKLNHRDVDSMTRKEKDELLLESIDAAIEKRINMARELGEKFPGKLSDIDHAANTTISKSDTNLDEFVKTLYHFKDKALRNKKYRKQIIDRMTHWNALSSFINKFRKPPAGANFNMMNFATNSEGTGVTNSIQSPEQLESLMRIINTLKDLTELQGIKYIDINYSETYPAAKGKKFTNRYVDSKSLTRSQLTNKHHKTRLKSVQIVETPVWKDGELVAGEVYFNFGRKDKKGKEGNQKILVLSKDMPLDKATNIMTSISLPFISTSTLELNERFDEEAAAVQENVSQDLTARNVALSEFKQAKKIKTETKDDWVIDEDEKGELSKEDLATLITQQVKDQGLVEDTPEKTVVPTKRVISAKNLQNGPIRQLFKIHIGQVYSKMDEIPKGRLEKLNKSLSNLGVKNLTDYLFALEFLSKDGIVEVNDRTIEIGEQVFNEKKEDCEGSGYHDNDVPF